MPPSAPPPSAPPARDDLDDDAPDSKRQKSASWWVKKDNLREHRLKKRIEKNSGPGPHRVEGREDLVPGVEPKPVGRATIDVSDHGLKLDDMGSVYRGVLAIDAHASGATKMHTFMSGRGRLWRYGPASGVAAVPAKTPNATPLALTGPPPSADGDELELGLDEDDEAPVVELEAHSPSGGVLIEYLDGNFSKGCLDGAHCTVIVRSPTTGKMETYKGGMKHGMRSGFGRTWGAEGVFHRGKLEAGRMHGEGQLFAAHFVFLGSWDKGLKHGRFRVLDTKSNLEYSTVYNHDAEDLAKRSASARREGKKLFRQLAIADGGAALECAAA